MTVFAMGWGHIMDREMKDSLMNTEKKEHSIWILCHEDGR
jgi:hypothetical protein